MEKLPFDWLKIRDTIVDSAKMGSNELKRAINETKAKVNKYQLIQKRKELFAELGRFLYEADEDGLPEEIVKFIKSTELHEIIDEIKQLDLTISEINKEKNV
jgi:hypothetical protein